MYLDLWETTKPEESVSRYFFPKNCSFYFYYSQGLFLVSWSTQNIVCVLCTPRKTLRVSSLNKLILFFTFVVTAILKTKSITSGNGIK